MVFTRFASGRTKSASEVWLHLCSYWLHLCSQKRESVLDRSTATQKQSFCYDHLQPSFAAQGLLSPTLLDLSSPRKLDGYINVATGYMNVARIFNADFFETETGNTKLDRPTSSEKLRSTLYDQRETRNTTQKRLAPPRSNFFELKSTNFEIHRNLSF